MLNYPSIAMADIKRLYNPGEHRHWFDKDTLRFFDSVLPAAGVRTEFGHFFITRETNPSGVKRFTVRRQDLVTCDIKTVGEFHEHEDYQDAKRSLADHLRQLSQQTSGVSA